MSLAVLAFLFVGCKKYEDGPTISLSSKKSRVVNVWEVEKVMDNGIDVTQAYLAFFPGFSIEMKKDNTYIITYTGSSNATTGTWDFDSNKENLITTPTGGTAQTAKINRLTGKELWVTETDGSDITEIHYKAK